MAGCLLDSTVIRFIEGQLPPEELPHVEEHLEQCSECRRLLAVVVAKSVFSQGDEGQSLSDGQDTQSRTSPARPVHASEAPTGRPVQQPLHIEFSRSVDSPRAAHPETKIARKLLEADVLPPAEGSLVREPADEGSFGNYRILGLLGKGGMSVVYLAEHPLIGRQVALKVLQRDLAKNAKAINRFFNEAKSTARIQHKGVVEIFDCGHLEGRPYIVMELLEGETLLRRIRREERIRASVVVALATQIADVLAAAHAEAIIHRDLKPENIFLMPDRRMVGGQRAKVLDFGIAKLAKEAQADTFKTRSGAFMGTPRYMAPEQCLSPNKVDARADIYSLGCIMFEMLCGRPPFSYRGMGQLIAAHLAETPPLPRSIEPSIPVELERILLRALDKRPAERYQTMRELADSLTRLQMQGAADGARVPSRPGAPGGELAAKTPFKRNHSEPRALVPASASHSASHSASLLASRLQTLSRPMLMRSRMTAPVVAAIAVVVVGVIALASRGQSSSASHAVPAAAIANPQVVPTVPLPVAVAPAATQAATSAPRAAANAGRAGTPVQATAPVGTTPPGAPTPAPAAARAPTAKALDGAPKTQAAASTASEEPLGSKLPPLELPSYQGNENMARRPFGPGKSARWDRAPRGRGKHAVPGSGPGSEHKALNKDGILDPDEM